MSWTLEFYQRPERFATNLAVDEILNVVENNVVCNWSFYRVILVAPTESGCDDEIEPFFCHFGKDQRS